MADHVILALGSNLNDPVSQVRRCVESIANLPKTTLLACSSLYSSSPRGPQDQADFVNAAVLIETQLAPVDLLRETQALEQKLGREKTRHWGERNIDIDIAFYAGLSIEQTNPDLCIPHREAMIRDFVVVPALDVAPNWTLPNGTLLRDAAGQCLQHDLHKIDANLACP